MRISLIGASSYQIFGLLDYYYNLTNFKDVKADFYLVGGFYNCEKFYSGLKECGAFSNVYLLKLGERKKIDHYYELLREVLSSAKSTMKYMTGDKNNDFVYDVILCENYFPVATFLRIINPEARFYIIEDGVAPYYIPMKQYLLNTYLLRERLYGRIKKKYIPFRVAGIYCYDPDFVRIVQEDGLECLKLNGLNECSVEYWHTVNIVFSRCTNYMYSTKQIIVIDSHGSNEESSPFEQYLLSFSNNVVVRPHPRAVSRAYKLPCVDRKLDAWELVCAEYIRDDHIIIGAYSTTQFVPKVLYDKEPWVVFTWSANSNNNDDNENNAVLRHIQHLKDLYKDESKVILIDDYSKLKTVIDSICGLG